VHDLTFDEPGERLASFGWDMTLRLWDVPTRRLLLILSDVRVVGFRRADGLQAATLQGARVRTWDVLLSEEHRILHGQPSRIHRLVFHPKRDWLATAGHDQEVRIWDARGGRVLARIPHPAGPGLLWARSGEGLLTH